ncbi:ribosomal protein L36-domain-containing protein, partial [Polychytrium aggregatum]|uniref:ribosomal protein L36-domain-containing protein n=1 Tax=Polychytrium aggregatum TaxID=110093 RepID=UPI0022FE50C3
GQGEKKSGRCAGRGSCVRSPPILILRAGSRTSRSRIARSSSTVRRSAMILSTLSAVAQRLASRPLLPVSTPILAPISNSLLAAGSAAAPSIWAGAMAMPSLSALTAPCTCMQTRGYKVKTSLKKRCEHCYFAKRRGRLYVICKEHPRHKQRSK